MSNKKLAICVPYRNREKHLNEFIPHMDKYCSENDITAKIFICNQDDDKKFNRGKLKNVAFDIAKKEGYDYFAFHDIDLLPEDNSADYRYPEKYPVHLSSRLSGYNYSLPYRQNFGGVVLFTKEQFEKINGYYNEYWDWGMEDDDLFWRCRINDYSKKRYYPNKLGIHNYAEFNGVDSSIKIPSSKKVLEAINGSYSISFLVKPYYRTDVASYLIGGHYDSKYPAIPLFTCNGYPILVYDNRNAFLGWARIGTNGEVVYADRDRGEWTYVTLTIDTKDEKVSIYINDGQHEELNLSKKYNGELLKFKDEIRIGSNDLNPILEEWILKKLNFKGGISEFCLWNRALHKNELAEIYKDGKLKLNNDGLVTHYDFNNIDGDIIKDLSGFGNDGEMENINIKQMDIGKLLYFEEPYRRDGKYLSLKHDTEGIVDFKFVNGELSKKNEKTFVTEVQTGIIDTKENGLNNLEYSINSTNLINDKHLMINVSL